MRTHEYFRWIGNFFLLWLWRHARRRSSGDVDGLRVRALAPDVSFDDVQSSTEASLVDGRDETTTTKNSFHAGHAEALGGSK